MQVPTATQSLLLAQVVPVAEQTLPGAGQGVFWSHWLLVTVQEMLPSAVWVAVAVCVPVTVCVPVAVCVLVEV